ncbi:hypothetical protein KM043_007863 [Ampulex compressa]|nr:hypothetical protein KM043_007863 [Ampulex compressa]
MCTTKYCEWRTVFRINFRMNGLPSSKWNSSVITCLVEFQEPERGGRKFSIDFRAHFGRITSPNRNSQFTASIFPPPHKTSNANPSLELSELSIEMRVSQESPNPIRNNLPQRPNFDSQHSRQRDCSPNINTGSRVMIETNYSTISPPLRDSLLGSNFQAAKDGPPWSSGSSSECPGHRGPSLDTRRPRFLEAS